ncbi:MAG: hypothetical protein HY869_13085 [Chloroflexi bacterium]|nr:hypothetical protein [Chloroflexota bacterium]
MGRETVNNVTQGGRSCPYLGLVDDADTSLAFPSAWNYCHRGRPGATPSLRYQAEFCLGAGHSQCPVFQNQQATLPRNTRVRGQQAPGRPFLAWTLIVVAILALGGLGWGLITPGLIFPIPTPTYTATPRPTLTPSPTRTSSPSSTPTATDTPSITPTLGTVTMTYTPTRTFTPTRTLTPSRTATITHTPSSTATYSSTPSLMPPLSKRGLEMPIGGDLQFVIHKVKVGENMNQYAAKYNTSIEAIVMINYKLKTPLWEDTLLVIPVGFTDISGLPSFEAHQVTEADRSAEALAAELGVSAADLALYNAIADGELLQPGDWILVPHSRAET